MGVPKFFRYISDRYPCLSEVVGESQIPEFDNLYLDMNGIIHTCSHPNDFDPHFRISEEKIYQDIFRYVEILFHMIKPRKLFFMAVDGVAPRAKMNQQRGRRFRSAKNAELLETMAKKKGADLPEEARFDSNCITPGTVFMTRLNDQLRYFIARKITTDKLWQRCKVVLSGHETPGEGEHKIMDYIRWMKSQPDQDGNTRHCLYGLDADLIMLGLCTHEPNFSLLREEVNFGKDKKSATTPEETKFHLLHLSILREYIEHEFLSVKYELSFEYDLEKIIDDWVLMGFLIGNDFIPNLPDFHIGNGALLVLYTAYMEVLPTLQGYLNEGGALMLDRFEKFMKHLSRVQDSNERLPGEVVRDKRDYYMKKLGYEDLDAEVLRSQAECYVRAIQWNLNYYYNGCCSWSWYYPHHYAPCISDIKGFTDFKFEFEMDQPFLPFQQLLAVLPASSKSLLPKPFQSLMTDAHSPIIDYYPVEFETDLNGKRNEWEALILIPFILETNLLKAMEPCYAKLTPEEKQRNSHGPMHVYSYTKEDLGLSKAPEYFQELSRNHAKLELVKWEDVIVPRDKLVKGLSPGRRLDVYFPGFPTFKHIEHRAVLRQTEKKGSYRVPGGGDKIVINILPSVTPNLADLANEILGTSVFVSWPNLVEAYVVAVSSRETMFKLLFYPDETVEKTKMDKGLINRWDQSEKTIAEGYVERLGINVGKTEVLVYAHVMIGRRYVFGTHGKLSLEKQWSDVSSPFALEAIVRDINVHDSNFVEYKNISQIFTPMSICFVLEHPHYGAMGKVIRVHTHFKTCRVKLAVWITREPNFDSFKLPTLHYMSCYEAAKKLGISCNLFGRITGTISVVQGPSKKLVKRKYHVGLNLKFNKKNEEVPGYTKKVNGQWLYSAKTIALTCAYKERYPLLFEQLEKKSETNTYSEDELFTVAGSTTPNDVSAWLKKQPSCNVKRRTCGTEIPDKKCIEDLEKAVVEFVEMEKEIRDEKTVTIQVKPHLLYKPDLHIGNFPPDETAEHKIYDRIVNVRDSFTVPLGYKGTIVGIQGAVNNSDFMFDVLFDKTFPGGLSLTVCLANRGYRLAPADFINLSHGLRTESFKSAGEGNAGTEP